MLYDAGSQRFANIKQTLNISFNNISINFLYKHLSKIDTYTLIQNFLFGTTKI